DRQAEFAAAPVQIAPPPRNQRWGSWSLGIRGLGARAWMRWGLAVMALILLAVTAAVLLRGAKSNPRDLTGQTPSHSPMPPVKTPVETPVKAPEPQEQFAPRKIELTDQNQIALGNKNNIREPRPRVKGRPQRHAASINDVAISNETVTD